MNRGDIGLLPRPTSLEDESYLEFVTSFREFAIQKLFPIVTEAGHEKLEEEMDAGRVARPEAGKRLPLSEIRSVFEAVPVARTWQRFVRTQQEMMWRRTRASFVADADELMNRMAAAAKAHPDRLHIDPDFEVPDYARREIHCQPGGYTGDPIGGRIYHYGTKIFYEGANDQDELHVTLANLAAEPEDGKVDRILDLACSVGQATTALKDRFPEAEVWGLDVAEPLVRYAHMRAAERGKEVHFKQALGEDTGYPDAHFDMVLSYILFHEVPVPVMKDILAELFRIIRPGGVLSIFEFPNDNETSEITPAYRFLVDYDSRDNHEPYSPAFVASDFRGMLEEAGFALAEGPPTGNPFLQSIVAARP